MYKYNKKIKWVWIKLCCVFEKVTDLSLKCNNNFIWAHKELFNLNQNVHKKIIIKRAEANFMLHGNWFLNIFFCVNRTKRLVNTVNRSSRLFFFLFLSNKIQFLKRKEIIGWVNKRAFTYIKFVFFNWRRLFSGTQ